MGNTLSCPCPDRALWEEKLQQHQKTQELKDVGGAVALLEGKEEEGKDDKDKHLGVEGGEVEDKDKPTGTVAIIEEKELVTETEEEKAEREKEARKLKLEQIRKKEKEEDRAAELAEKMRPESKQGIALRVVKWGWDEKKWWGAGYAALVVNSYLSSYQPRMFTDVVASVTNPSSHHFMRAIGNLMGVSLFSCGTGVVQSVCMSEASFRLNMKLKRMLLNNVLNQDMGFFDTTTAGDLITQVNSTSGATSLLTRMAPTVVRSTVIGLNTGYILSQIDIRLAMIALISVPLETFMSYHYSKIGSKYSEEVQECNSKTGTIIQETMYGIRAIRPLHGQGQQTDKFLDQLNELNVLQKRQRWILGGQTVLQSILPHATGILLLWTGGHWARQGVIDITSLMTVSMYQSTLQGSMQALMGLYVQWGSMTGSTKRVFRYLDRIPEQKTRGEYTPADGKLTGGIHLKNVSFSYPRSQGKKTLTDFNLDISPGETVALVGPSGGGKSTLINLMVGMYDPTEGEIELDGRPLADYDPAFLYVKGVAVVQQSPNLFRGTVSQNIVFGLPEDSVTQEEIEDACKQANAHEFIMNLPNKYDTDLGVNGNKLSGGQRQRIAIARAFVRKPSILLLDEPTASLDNQSEAAVKAALWNVMRDRTVIIVAHRLTTVQHIPRIIVIDGGKIVEEGTHDNLVANGKLYYALAAGVFAEEAAKKRELYVKELEDAARSN